jgi:hypothetical protein
LGIGNTSNLLTRWREAGLVDRVAPGHYAIRQIGLLDGAARMDLIGGANVLAEALSAAQPDPAVLERLAQEIGAAAALRRIGSLADQACPSQRSPTGWRRSRRPRATSPWSRETPQAANDPSATAGGASSGRSRRARSLTV